MSATSEPSLPIGVIGSGRFNAGFALAGVRACIASQASDARDDIAKAVGPAHSLGPIGILLVEEELLSSWSRQEKERLLSITSPVVMFLSAKQEVTLASQVKRALGIDLASVSARAAEREGTATAP